MPSPDVVRPLAFSVPPPSPHPYPNPNPNPNPNPTPNPNPNQASSITRRSSRELESIDSARIRLGTPRAGTPRTSGGADGGVDASRSRRPSGHGASWGGFAVEGDLGLLSAVRGAGTVRGAGACGGAGGGDAGTVRGGAGGGSAARLEGSREGATWRTLSVEQSLSPSLGFGGGGSGRLLGATAPAASATAPSASAPSITGALGAMGAMPQTARNGLASSRCASARNWPAPARLGQLASSAEASPVVGRRCTAGLF